MSGVTLHVDNDMGITTMIIVGRVRADEVITVLNKFYSDSPTLLALCDLSRADLSLFSNVEITKIVEFTVANASTLGGGKTAIMAVKDFEYGMARMYEILTEVYNHPVAIKAFRGREQAPQWLFDKP